MSKIGLIDYGMGNIHSVTKALESLDQEIILIKNKDQTKDCKAVILPGVGSFDPAINNLINTDLISDIKIWIKSGKSFLGICLGLQLLFESSEEGLTNGLGIVKGQIKKIPVLDQVAAVSCGIYNGQVLLDLDYDEDSAAGVDANFVLTGAGKIIEVQATAEDKAFEKSEFNELLQLAEIGISQLVKLQKHALGIE